MTFLLNNLVCPVKLIEGKMNEHTLPTLGEILQTEIELVNNRMKAHLALDFGIRETSPLANQWSSMAWPKVLEMLESETRMPLNEHTLAAFQKTYGQEMGRLRRMEEMVQQLRSPVVSPMLE